MVSADQIQTNLKWSSDYTSRSRFASSSKPAVAERADVVKRLHLDNAGGSEASIELRMACSTIRAPAPAIAMISDFTSGQSCSCGQCWDSEALIEFRVA